MKDEELTGKVIGLAMEVHRELGAGYLEKVYENALALVLREAGFSVEQQCPIPVVFHGKIIGDFVADIVVDDKLIIELKAVSALNAAHEVQLVSYLKSTGIEIGLLINFGAASLQFKRKYRGGRSADSFGQDLQD